MSSARQHYKHKRCHLNEFLTEELDGLIGSVDAATFLRFAGPALHDRWNGEEWRTMTQSLGDDDQLQSLKQVWLKASPEVSQYKPFCEWVQSFLPSRSRSATRDVKSALRRLATRRCAVPQGTRTEMKLQIPNPGSNQTQLA